jgi:outer membrane protein assembly factor BamD (BamD/ComL family)
MRLNQKFISAVVFIILCFACFPGYSQTGFSFDIKKPEQYDDRILGSEKSESKKFSLPRRFFQNTFTHYNYVFNANNKLNEILLQAKQEHLDDYTELLSFYNYSLDVTAENRQELDSVIYKSTTGIVLHDLRNDWIDNLYLLTGAAYYLRKQFDSAYLTFQFINYAYAKKEKDGYYQTIGSKFDGNNAFSISTKEKNSLPRRLFTEPPSRNDAFVWQIRTLIAMEEYAEAASLIVTLKNDPVFPSRLKNDLEEVQALWFYNNNVYDSAAVHLEKALSNAANKRESARWEFLIAQLYELSGKTEMAKSFYSKVISHTIDPVMEIYARLRSIRLNKAGGDNYIDANIAELMKMVKRDKYYEYRDVIYYTIAQMELERNNAEGAISSLVKSTQNSVGNPSLKNKTFLQLADIHFAQKKYKEAKSYYDSLNMTDQSLKRLDEIAARKDALAKVVTQLAVVERQDSLQRIAALPEEERKEFVKKLVKQLRKQQGLKEETTSSTVLVPIGQQQSSTQQPDLFGSNSSKGDWYFYNAALKTKGAADFKARWGNRPNADNWRRAAAISLQASNRPVNNASDVTQLPNEQKAISGEISFDALYENLPLTEELLKISNDSLSTALFILGKTFANELEDCPSCIETNDKLVDRYPAYKKMDSVLFYLYYCYKKTGKPHDADDVKNVLTKKYPDSRLTKIATTGKDPGSQKNPEATRAYEKIYDLFIEGDFTKAVADKTAADKIYGSMYWTPQLMYIEAVYYIKQKDDEKATQILGDIISNFQYTPMAEKAATMMDVLSRRLQIEEELKNLNVQRVIVEKPVVVDEVAAPKKDTVAITPLPQKEKPVQQQVVKAPEVKPEVKQVDTLANRPAITSYSFKPEDKYFAVIVLTKVDMVWVNETKNAFTIYNRNKFFNRQFDYTVSPLNNEYKLLLIGGFENANAAADYVAAVKPPVSNAQIVPWLAVDKYSFTIISAANLEILKTQQDINLYKQFIQKNVPGKF